MKRSFYIVILSIFMLNLAGCSSINEKVKTIEEEKTILKIATTIDGDYIKEVIDVFNTHYPNTIIECYTYDFEKIKDLIKDKKIDIVYGLSEEKLKELKEDDKLYSYKSKEYDNIKDNYKNEENYYICMYGYTPILAYNKKLLKDKDLNIPKGFSDLQNEEYKDNFIMPHKDITMYNEVEKILGKETTNKIYENAEKTSKYNHGIAEALNKEKTPMAILPDYEGLFSSWDDGNVEIIYGNRENIMLEGMAIINNDEIKKQAKEFIDWNLSEEAFNVMAKNRDIIGRKSIESKMKKFQVIN